MRNSFALDNWPAKWYIFSSCLTKNANMDSFRPVLTMHCLYTEQFDSQASKYWLRFLRMLLTVFLPIPKCSLSSFCVGLGISLITLISFTFISKVISSLTFKSFNSIQYLSNWLLYVIFTYSRVSFQGGGAML